MTLNDLRSWIEDQNLPGDTPVVCRVEYIDYAEREHDYLVEFVPEMKLVAGIDTDETGTVRQGYGETATKTKVSVYRHHTKDNVNDLNSWMGKGVPFKVKQLVLLTLHDDR